MNNKGNKNEEQSIGMFFFWITIFAIGLAVGIVDFINYMGSL